MRKTLILAVGFFVCVFFSTSMAAESFAQAAPAPAPKAAATEAVESLMFMDVPNVYVASKKEESAMVSPGTTYVITDKDIENYGWRDLKEILKAIPSMDSVNTFNWEKTSQRGLAPTGNTTLLCIDGRPVNDIIADEAFINEVYPAVRIKRVEVLEGPSSILYGSNAMAGVINIITKDGPFNKDNVSEVQAMEGDTGTQQFAGVFKKTYGDNYVSASSSKFSSNRDWKKLKKWATTDSVSYRTGSALPGVFQNPATDQALAVSAKVGSFYAGLEQKKADTSKGLEVAEDRLKETDNRGYSIYYIGVDHKVTEDLSFKIDFSRHDEINEWFQADSQSGRQAMPAKTTNLTSQVNYTIGQHALTAGYDWTKADLLFEVNANNAEFFPSVSAGWWDSGKVAAGVNQFHRSSLYGQDKFTVIEDKFIAIAGLSYNVQSLIPKGYSPRISLIYLPNKSSAVKFTYGTGFRAPSVWETGSWGVSGGTVLVPHFKPQNIDMYELNYTQQIDLDNFKAYNIAAIYKESNQRFYNQQFNSSTGLWEVDQGAKNYVNGIEDMLRVSLMEDKLGTIFGFRVVEPKKIEVSTTNSGTKRVSLDIPTTRVKLGLDYKFTKLITSSLFVDYSSAIKTKIASIGGGTEFSRIKSSAPVDWNLRLGDFDYSGAKVSLDFYVGNIFNKAYFDPNAGGTQPIDYMQPPRNYRATIDVKF